MYQTDLNKRNIELAEYCYVGSGRRFAEYLIDYFVIYVLAVIFYMFNPETIDIPGSSYIVSFVLLIIYYFIMEAACGKTLGKIVLGLKVVDAQGNKPSVGRILLRSVCRCIPFDALSFLFGNWKNDGSLSGNWHDSLSKTYVVRTKIIPEYNLMRGHGNTVVSNLSEAQAKTTTDFEVGDIVIYPYSQRIMTIGEKLENGMFRCYSLDVNGDKVPEGDYKPAQLEHYRKEG